MGELGQTSEGYEAMRQLLRSTIRFTGILLALGAAQIANPGLNFLCMKIVPRNAAPAVHGAVDS